MATVGRLGSSGTVKRTNKLVSSKALAELENLQRVHKDKKEVLRKWHNLTTNEHPEPLNEVWKWLCSESRSPRELLERLGKNKFVTILRVEDKEINDRGLRSTGTPEERHKFIDPVEMPIQIFETITISDKKMRSKS